MRDLQEKSEEKVNGGGGSTLSPTSPISPQEDESRPRLAVGMILNGRFQVLRSLGQGGMGEVYEAEDMELGQRVALKTLRTAIASDESAVQRFQREIVTARRVTHPGVCRTFDFFRNREDENGDAASFLTMELLRGETLAERLKREGPFECEQALPLVRQMVDALAAAHRVGIVHRDFKSNNVMLVPQEDGLRVVITDFGLAQDTRAVSKDGSVTNDGEIVGSPAYIAPEQVEGLKATPRSDQYSLGVVIYEMLTGRRPLEGKNMMLILARRLSEDPTPPSRYRPQLGGRWDAVVLRCLARAPEERFSQIEDLMESLEYPVHPRPVKTAPWKAAVVGLLCTAALLAGWFFRPAPDQPAQLERVAIAVLPLQNHSRQADTDWLGPTLAEMLTSELGIGGNLRTVSGELVSRMERDLELPHVDSLAPDTLRRIQGYLNTDLLVLGSYFKSGPTRGDPLRLDLRVQDVESGEILATFRETFSEDEVLQLVPKLGLQIRRLLGVGSITSDAATTTLPANSEAARLYTRGLEDLRRFDLVSATDLLRRSAEEDSEHPLTYLALGEVLWSRGIEGEAREQIALAFERSSGLPRQERFLVEAKYYETMANWEPAIERLRTLYEFFPDNVEYGLALARVLRSAGESARSLEVLAAMRAAPVSGRLDPRIDEARAEAFHLLSQFAAAKSAAIAARNRAQAMGVRFLIPRCLILEARALWRLGALEEASEITATALHLFEQNGDQWGIASAGNLAGIIAGEMGFLDEAWERYEGSLAAFRQLGHLKGVETLLNNLGTISHQRGDYAEAARRFEEVLTLARDLAGDVSVVTYLTNLAQVEMDLGEIPQALRHAEEALSSAQKIDARLQALKAHLALGRLHRVQGNLSRSEFEVSQAQDLLRVDDNPLSLVGILNSQARLAHHAKDFQTARRLLLEVREIHLRTSGESRIDALSVQLAILDFDAGEVDSARQELRRLISPLTAAEPEGSRTAAWMALVYLEMLEGEHDAAREILRVHSADRKATEHFMTEIWATVLKAWTDSTSLGSTPDLKVLREIEEQLGERGLRPRLLKVRSIRGEIEVRRGDADVGLDLLREVEREAGERGFEVLAERARRIREKAEPSP